MAGKQGLLLMVGMLCALCMPMQLWAGYCPTLDQIRRVCQPQDCPSACPSACSLTDEALTAVEAKARWGCMPAYHETGLRCAKHRKKDGTLACRQRIIYGPGQGPGF